MFRLNELTSIVKKRKRVGRGGSRGGTSGKGGKGQTQRSGGQTAPGFEGGQMPLSRRLPKRGFNNYRFSKEFAIINLDQLAAKFNDGDEITIVQMAEKSLLRHGKNGAKLPVKILGSANKLEKKLIVTANAFSRSAEAAIKAAGGEVRLTRES